MMSSPRYLAATAMIGCLMWANGAQAQNVDMGRVQRAMRQAEQQYQMMVQQSMTLGERAVLDYGGLETFGFYAIDDTDQRTHILRENDLQLYGRINIDDVHEVFGRFRWTYQDFNTGDSFDGNGDGTVWPLFDRFWYRFDLGRAIEVNEGERSPLDLDIRVGRQYVEWATGLTLSDQLYAVHGTLTVGDIQLEGLASTSPASTMIDFDSSRPSYDADTRRDFFGGLVRYTGLSDHRPFVHVLIQHDRNDQDFAVIDPGGLNIPTRFEYDSIYLGVGATGTLLPRLSYRAEFAWETGDGLSTSLMPGGAIAIPQQSQDINAWAARAELAYLFRDDNRTRLEFETILASGDDDRDLDTSNTFGGNAPGTDDTAFNGFGFAKTGLAYASPLSNLMLFRLGASTFPLRSQRLFEHMQVGVDFIMHHKFDGNAPIDEDTHDTTYIGWETDLFFAWRITSDVSLNVRYGVFFPGSAIKTDHDARHFLYSGITYAF